MKTIEIIEKATGAVVESIEESDHRASRTRLAIAGQVNLEDFTVKIRPDSETIDERTTRDE